MSMIKNTRLLALIVPLLLNGCVGGGSPSEEAKAPSSAPGKVPTSVGEAIVFAEHDGSLPSLNRDDTLAGPDVDGNHVRDDIDTYINTLPDSPQQKAALRQSSAALSKAMVVDLLNQSALLEASAQISAAARCRHTQYDSATATEKALEMRKITVNTKARVLAYVKFNQALNGTTSVSPEGDGCAK